LYIIFNLIEEIFLLYKIHLTILAKLAIWTEAFSA